MAKLNSFRINSAAVENGDWVRPGEEYDDLEIKLRGATDEYNDARNAKLRKAALAYNGDQRQIPVATSRAIMVDCLDQFAILDVRNLVDADGAAVTRDQFVKLLRDPNYVDLVLAVVKAMSKVGLVSADSIADAAGNSAAPSTQP